MIQRALLVLLLLASARRRPFANSAKVKCKTCKDFVDSFNKGLEKTAKSNYAGGDTSWEEEKLGSYADSEVRLVEVLDTVCSKSDYDCSRLLEVSEEDVERWWFKLRKQEVHRDMKKWLCQTHLDVCCPENTFGPRCEPCPGSPDNICGGHGKCKGAGEKDGSGECSCDTGYKGVMCQSCDTKYYRDNSEDNSTEPQKLECKECDMSCKSCDGPGPEDCGACADGYKESDGGACEDVDECHEDPDSKCREGTFCFNLPGSFRCNDCDKSCNKACNGFGPSKCADCATGYTRDEQGTCKDDDECEKGVASCRDGTYCENTPGKYTCKACHVACMGGCHGAGSEGCVACKEGYKMDDTEGCTDVDECESDSAPCNKTTEFCSNLPGSFVCKCAGDLVRGDNEECVTEAERKKQRDSLKEKKKKRKKKRKVKKANKPNKAEGEGRNGNGQNGETNDVPREIPVEDSSLKAPKQEQDSVVDVPETEEEVHPSSMEGEREHVGTHNNLPAPDSAAAAELLKDGEGVAQDKVHDDFQAHSDHTYLDGQQESMGEVVDKVPSAPDGGRDEL